MKDDNNQSALVVQQVLDSEILINDVNIPKVSKMMVLHLETAT